MAGYAAYLKIDGFNILPVLSISMAGTTFTGQNVGAHKLDRVKKGMYSALAMVLIYTVFIGTVLLLSSHQVLGLFTHNEEVIKYGQLAMKYFCPFYFLLGILNTLAGTVRGAGKGVPPMLILLFQCVFSVFFGLNLHYRFIQPLTVYLFFILFLGLSALFLWHFIPNSASGYRMNK